MKTHYLPVLMAETCLTNMCQPSSTTPINAFQIGDISDGGDATDRDGATDGVVAAGGVVNADGGGAAALAI